MNKKIDLSKILAKGSAKQRALLYFNAWAEDESGGESFLTEAERDQLFKSFKTEAEGKVFNSIGETRRAIKYGIFALKQNQFVYRETIETLRGYCLLYHGYTEFADTLSGLYFAMKTPEDKKKVLAYLEKHKRYLWAEIGPGKDPDTNGISVLPGWDLPKTNKLKDPKTPRQTPRIRELLETLSARAKRQLAQCKAFVKGIRDVIEEKGFYVKVYTDEINRVDNDLKDDKAPLPKFSRKKTEAGLLSGDDLKQKKQLEEIFGPNWIFPEYDAVETDEADYKAILEVMGVQLGKRN